jgi:E3 ubiquitin-protein ligase synoviolin
MEGTERRAVEARIQALRNIQVLLDAAMLQFQQYLTASSQAGPSAWTNNNNNSADQPSTSSAGTSAEVNQPAQTGTSTLTTNIAPPTTT